MKTNKPNSKGKKDSKKSSKPQAQATKAKLTNSDKLKASIANLRRLQADEKSSTQVEIHKERKVILKQAAKHLTNVTTTLERLERTGKIVDSFMEDLDPLETNVGNPFNHKSFNPLDKAAEEAALLIMKPTIKLLEKLFDLPAHNGLEDLVTEALVLKTCSLSTYLNKYFDEHQASYPSQVVNGLMFCQIFSELILSEKGPSSLKDRCICYSDNIRNVTEFKVGVICGYIKISDILNSGLVYVAAFSAIDRLELRSFLKSYVRIQSEL